MRKYLKFHGMNIDNGNGLPVFTESPEAAMVNMPDGYWNFLVDPDETLASPARALQRVSNALISNASANIPLGSFPNGATAFEPGGGSNGIGFTSDRAIKPTEWTAFTVFKAREAAVVSDIFNAVTSELSEPDVALRISISANGNNLNVLRYSSTASGTPIRLQYSTSDMGTRSDPTLLMVTFSVERGLSIWDNGVEVEHDAGETDPLQANFGAGQWRAFRSARHHFGLTGQLNADLAKPKNAIFRQMIERHCRAKYDIAAIPE